MAKKAKLKNHTGNFVKYKYLLRELIVKDIKLQYRNSFLGVVWTFLQPLLTMIVLAFVFNNLFGRNSPEVVNYPVYLLTGRLLFNFFTQSTKRSMRSIRSHSSIIKKVYVPKYIYPLSSVGSCYVTFLISLLVLVGVILFFNIRQVNPIAISWPVVFAVIPIIILLFLSLGIGMILATMDVFFKDVENIYDVFTLLLFYVTPIVYTIDRLGFKAGSIEAFIIKLNPMYGIIEMFRAAVLHSTEFMAYFSFKQLVYCCSFALVCNIIGFILFYKKQDKFILHI